MIVEAMPHGIARSVVLVPEMRRINDPLIWVPLIARTIVIVIIMTVRAVIRSVASIRPVVWTIGVVGKAERAVAIPVRMMVPVGIAITVVIIVAPAAVVVPAITRVTTIVLSAIPMVAIVMTAMA